MVKKKVLDIDRESVRQRMEAGEQMDTAAVWKATATGTYQWAYATLSRWHKAGLVHVAQWHKRTNGGQPQPTFATRRERRSSRLPQTFRRRRAKRPC